MQIINTHFKMINECTAGQTPLDETASSTVEQIGVQLAKIMEYLLKQCIIIKNN